MAKMDVYDHLDESRPSFSTPRLAAEGRSYDLVPAITGFLEVAATLENQWNVPEVQMFHTSGLVEREFMDEDNLTRERISESRSIASRCRSIGRGIAASKDRAHELARLYLPTHHVGGHPLRVDPSLFHPVRQADSRE